MFFALKYKKLKIIYDLTEVGFFSKIKENKKLYTLYYDGKEKNE